jgi:hypothetical protein
MQNAPGQWEGVGGVRASCFCNFVVCWFLPHLCCYKEVAITKKHCKRAQVDKTAMGNEEHRSGSFIVKTKQGI